MRRVFHRLLIILITHRTMNCRKDLDSNIQTWSKSRFISDSIACIFENDFRELAEDGKDSGVKVSIL